MTTTTTFTQSMGDGVVASPNAVFPRAAKPNIAFIGKAGAGKTTAAEVLVRSYGYERLSFASILKDVAVQLWGEGALTDREKLQLLGTEVARQIDPDTWCNAMFRQLDARNSLLHPVVIDDCRFENEYWGLKERGFTIVRLFVEESVREARLLANGKLQDREQLYHESETALDGVEADYALVIDEDVSKTEFESRIDELYRKIVVKQP